MAEANRSLSADALLHHVVRRAADDCHSKFTDERHLPAAKGWSDTIASLN